MATPVNDSKASLAFHRKLYLCWLISREQHNLGSLQKATGMPRRTLQDTLKSVDDIGIDCRFEQQEGGRNNQGHYLISDWGPIQPEWIEQRADEIADALGIVKAEA
ncbi:winged helix-turn-helix domain-containing protein [Marinobacterium sp. YM272]|uniref:winged helix-turn-helix domain-containing protein n=1 Tax=Marinobacterium sp. YM272 TaxID=3421654 RepID=UPI003D7FD356